MNIALLAARIYVKLHECAIFAERVYNSNEPYRAMHMECKIPEAEEIIDGSPQYVELIDYLENLNSYDSMTSGVPQTSWADRFQVQVIHEIEFPNADMQAANDNKF